MTSRFSFARAGLFCVGLLAISAPASAIDWARLLGQVDAACPSATSCTVAGAEVDDEATIAARKATGTGPAVGIASDRRVKSDITQVGTLENGIKIYSFKFLWEDQIRVGVIAQDLLERADSKGAVLTLSNGLLGVDYTSLGLRMATQKQWQTHGLASLKADYNEAQNRVARLVEPVRLYNKR